MLDRWTSLWVSPPLKAIAVRLQKYAVTPDQVTLAGFVMGMTAIPLLAIQAYSLALAAILLNRIMDGVDGALARLHKPTDAGGYLDITLDFIFYSGIAMGFAFADPERNALMASVLIFSFMGTGASFLAYAIMAEKRKLSDPRFSHKSFYYMNGFAEGTETIAVFVLFCLFPHFFPQLAGAFAVICILTTAVRVWGGYQTIKEAEVPEQH